jgi:hypothetical protein
VQRRRCKRTSAAKPWSRLRRIRALSCNATVPTVAQCSPASPPSPSRIDSGRVIVEVDVPDRGLSAFTIVGLPDRAVRESRERVRAALKNSGFTFPTAGSL